MEEWLSECWLGRGELVGDSKEMTPEESGREEWLSDFRTEFRAEGGLWVENEVTWVEVSGRLARRERGEMEARNEF
jgi:hypothetical protein